MSGWTNSSWTSGLHNRYLLLSGHQPVFGKPGEFHCSPYPPCFIVWLPPTPPTPPVSTGSRSRDGDVVVYVFHINQPSLPTPFYSVLVSVSVFMTLSTVFHSLNFPNNSPLSHSVLPVLFLPHWSFQLYIFFNENLPHLWHNPLWKTGLKAPTN